MTYSDPEFTVTPQTTGSPVVVHSVAGVTQLSFCFDQNGNTTIAYTQAAVAYLYWFDTLAGMYVTTASAEGAISPAVTLDDKRVTQTQSNDIILMYTKQEIDLIYTLFMRRQRDRFLIEYEQATGVRPHIVNFGMHKGLRLQISLQGAFPPPVESPTVILPTFTDITETTATLGGNVTSDNGHTVTERGTVWGLTSNPNIIDEAANKNIVAGTTGVFTGPVTGLPSGTLIHFRAYAINSEGTSYSTNATFTTTSSALVFDTFTDTNGTSIEAHTPDIDTVGSGWINFGAATLEIESNQLVAVGASTSHSATIDAGVAGVTVMADMVMDNDNNNAEGLWLRQDGSSHGYFVGITLSQDTNPELTIWEWAGSFVVKASVPLTGEGPLSGIPLTIEAIDTGTNITAEVVVGGNTYNVNFATTTFNTETFVGVRATKAAVDTRFDNFTVTAT
jgi:hypothetical protein